MFRDELAEYKQPDGLVVPKNEQPSTEKPDTTGNGITYFSIAHALMVRLGISRPEDLEEFNRVIRSCYVKKGILNRSPTKTEELNGKDDYVHVAYAAKLLKSPVAYEILNAGNVRRLIFFKWFYKNIKPENYSLLDVSTYKSWRGMNPEVIAHFQWCCLESHGVRPHFLRILWQAIYLCVVSTKHPGLNILNHTMIQAAKNHSDLIYWAGSIWENRVIKKWGSVLNSFKNELEDSHPIVKYWGPR